MLTMQQRMDEIATVIKSQGGVIVGYELHKQGLMACIHGRFMHVKFGRKADFPEGIEEAGGVCVFADYRGGKDGCDDVVQAIDQLNDEGLTRFEVQGNNGGSYVEIASLENGMCQLTVGETCVQTIDMPISVSALSAILTWAKDQGFQRILDHYSGGMCPQLRPYPQGTAGTRFKVDKDHWTC